MFCNDEDEEQLADFDDIVCPIYRKICMQMGIKEEEMPEIYQFTDEEIIVEDHWGECVQFTYGKYEKEKKPKVIKPIKGQEELF